MRNFVLRAVVWLVVGGMAGAAPAAASPFSGLYVFGDSLSDVGNVSLATGGLIPAAPYAAGRFSNGPIWADRLAAQLGLGPLLPSLAGGTDFAFGGAVTGPAVPGGNLSVPTITQQVGLFGQATGAIAPAAGLYAVWIGSNDVFAAVSDVVAGTLTLGQAQAALTQAAQTEVSAIGMLMGAGAKTFLVPLVPDLGKTPDAQAVGAAALATGLSQFYDAALLTALQPLISNTSITLRTLDTFSLIDAAVANPVAFGFTNASDPCYTGAYTGGGAACAVPDSYLFWDGRHPTAAGHALIAQLAITELPEPPAVLLLLAALCGMLVVRPLRRARSAR